MIVRRNEKMRVVPGILHLEVPSGDDIMPKDAQLIGNVVGNTLIYMETHHDALTNQGARL